MKPVRERLAQDREDRREAGAAGEAQHRRVERPWQMEAAVGPVERDLVAEPPAPCSQPLAWPLLVARDEELEQAVGGQALAVGRVGDRVGPGLADARRPELDVHAGAVAEAHLPAAAPSRGGGSRA